MTAATSTTSQRQQQQVGRGQVGPDDLDLENHPSLVHDPVLDEPPILPCDDNGEISGEDDVAGDDIAGNQDKEEDIGEEDEHRKRERVHLEHQGWEKRCN